MIDLTAAAWRKSSYSGADADNCVEIADNIPGAVPVRDSKVPDGPVLVFKNTTWASFVQRVRAR
ncbi:DUF397 domain-containing protein [Streptomyces spirodelae]|uniref:DUF397 domain-containing protein n=1 Tax=Streptomyces spirodelae TaxID=2812904 RepID=A0ABS3WNS8_9ACTN|nr:DUF397 domain-containing protein [Streptomyces spirodelae]MBO8184778.1 DUF397 domain-containing protein [Streptomyces spirodelae]